MAVVFGVPLLVPLGMMPNGQMWGGGGREWGSIFEVRRVQAKELP